MPCRQKLANLRGVIPYTLIDSSSAHGTTLHLYRRGEEFSIRVDRQQGELMNSRLHHSEDVLAELACARIAHRKAPRLLVGGLGMGFTLGSALAHAPADARITVAELMPAVVRWNREYLGALAGFPLDDARVTVLEQDVGRVMREHREGFDAIMLDVDNGPDGFTREGNDDLYGYPGLNIAYDALSPGGALTVWSCAPDRAFTQRLQKIGFGVEERSVHAREGGRGDRHHLWLAIRRP
jgi:spermidine synthase